MVVQQSTDGIHREPATPIADPWWLRFHCGACLRFRWHPGHWLSCR